MDVNSSNINTANNLNISIEPADVLFFLHKGAINGFNDHGIRALKIIAGEIFGETDFFFGVKSSYLFVVKKAAVVHTIDKKKFFEIIKENCHLHDFRNLPLLSLCSHEELESLSIFISCLTFTPGEDIVCKGKLKPDILIGN